MDMMNIYRYTVAHWKDLCNASSCWPTRNREPVSIAGILSRRFNICYSDASRIARSVAILMNIK